MYLPWRYLSGEMTRFFSLRRAMMMMEELDLLDCPRVWDRNAPHIALKTISETAESTVVARAL